MSNAQMERLLDQLLSLLEDLDRDPPSKQEEEATGLPGLIKQVGGFLEQVFPFVGPLLALL